MKKILPYILVGIILVAAGILIFTGKNDKKRKLDERLSFNKKDKIPYGAYVAYENLKYLFPNAAISASSSEPGSWDSLSNYSNSQALIIVSPIFFANDFEIKKLIRFAEGGNDVFISTALVSEEVRNVLNCSISYLDMYSIFNNDQSGNDTLELSLTHPPFQRTYNYMYPGLRLDCHFYKVDTSITTVLGMDHAGNPDFVHLKAGQGNVYLHLAPMAFSNYFLLRGKNMKYYEDALSVISPGTKTIVWDEYYLNKRSNYDMSSSDYGNKNWLSSLFSYPPLKWALLTALFTLLVYVLLEMRRKQRVIPVLSKPRNDSMDFVKTIGRLYFDKGDHKNLCRKMTAYFLEHVRNRYKIPTAELNENFIRDLQFKSGVPESEVRAIVFFIKEMETSFVISDQQLTYFHKQLESFYSKT